MMKGKRKIPNFLWLNCFSLGLIHIFICISLIYLRKVKPPPQSLPYSWPLLTIRMLDLCWTESSSFFFLAETFKRQPNSHCNLFAHRRDVSQFVALVTISSNLKFLNSRYLLFLASNRRSLMESWSLRKSEEAPPLFSLGRDWYQKVHIWSGSPKFLYRGSIPPHCWLNSSCQTFSIVEECWVTFWVKKDADVTPNTPVS